MAEFLASPFANGDFSVHQLAPIPATEQKGYQELRLTEKKSANRTYAQGVADFVVAL
jgi:hypothetical protein